MINRFYYSKCSDIEKQVYTIIWDGLADYQEIITLGRVNTSFEMINRVFKMVLFDNPRIFYTCTQGYEIGSIGSSFYLKPKYFFSLQAVLELQNWIDERLDEICNPIRHIEDAFSKEIYIHNYLVEKVKYSKTAVSQPINAYTVAGTLLENRSVCAGVALTFKLLMDYLDIPCIVAAGMAASSEGVTDRHAWNIVCIEGAYYQVDVTWDLLEGDRSRLIQYDYFNLTSEEMYLSRVPEYEYPICDQREFNYFYYMNAIVNSPDELRAFISEKVAKGERTIYYKYMFDINGMKRNLNKYLQNTPLTGSYSYWINEREHTVYIMR